MTDELTDELTDHDLAWLSECLRDDLADGWTAADGYLNVMTSAGYVALYPDGRVRAYGETTITIKPAAADTAPSPTHSINAMTDANSGKRLGSQLTDDELVDLLDAVGDELLARARTTIAEGGDILGKANAFTSAYCGISFHVADMRKVTR